MAQAKKKTATKTAKKTTRCNAKKQGGRSGMRYEKYQRGQKPNMFFVISMSILAASILFADIIFINA